MTARLDVHSPGSIVPADYTFLFCYAHPTTVNGWPVPGFNMGLLIVTRTGEPFYDTRLHSTIQPRVSGDGKLIRFSKIHKHGPCDVCGAYHVEGSVFVHDPSGEAVALGWRCAEKLELNFDASQRALLAGKRKKARQFVVLKAKRRLFLREFVGDAPAEFLAALKTDHPVVRAIRASIIRRSVEPSGPQVQVVLKITREKKERDSRPEEKHVQAPISDKRQRVEGKIVSIKWKESVYGGAYKITVKIETPDGSWLTWGTLPSALEDFTQEITAEGLKGALIAFDARLTQSSDSNHFTFFKRPTKPVLFRLDSDAARERLERYRAEIEDEETNPHAASREWLEDHKVKRDALAVLLA